MLLKKLVTALGMVFIFNHTLLAEELVVIFGENRPPFVFNEGGLEVDIVRESLQVRGHSLKAIHIPVARMKQHEGFEMGNINVDAIAGVSSSRSSSHLSNEYISYHNYAVTKSSSGIILDKIADLKGKNIVAWKNARNELGEEFKSLFSDTTKRSSSSNYLEHSNQEKQVEMFWRNRAQVLVIDRTVFLWQTNNLSSLLDTSAAVEYHNIFDAKTMFYVAFKNQGLRDDFNYGLNTIKQNGRYNALWNEYMNQP